MRLEHLLSGERAYDLKEVKKDSPDRTKQQRSPTQSANRRHRDTGTSGSTVVLGKTEEDETFAQHYNESYCYRIQATPRAAAAADAAERHTAQTGSPKRSPLAQLVRALH